MLLSLEQKSEDIVNCFLHSTGLSLPLFDSNTPAVWLRCGLDCSTGRAGEVLGVLRGVDDTELLLEIIGDAGNEWTCNTFDGPLIQGCDKICSRVGLSLGFIESIQDIRSLASTKTKQRRITDESKFFLCQ